MSASLANKMDRSTLLTLIPDEAYALVREFEGLRLEAYLDTGGIPTIGYGHTGPDVRLGDRINIAEATRLMEEDLIDSLEALMRLVPGILKEKSGRVAALMDFIFNLGSARFEHSTLRQRVLSSDWELVPFELRRWVKGRSEGKLVPLPGLVRRRQAEADLV